MRAMGVTLKYPLLAMLLVPLLLSVIAGNRSPSTSTASAAAGEAGLPGEETPFVLLATVHNYGYIEPCG